MTAISRHFHRPDGRADFERARRDHNATLLAAGTEPASTGLLELGLALDAGVARSKRELLASSLCANDETQATVAWIHRQHRALAEMGSRVAEAMRMDPAADAVLGERVAALTLHHWTEALKWATSRQRPDYTVIHAIQAHATRGGRQRAVLTFMAEGRGRATTLEALYFRALMVDRFATGNLTRTQLELLDAWLWEWVGALQGADGPPEGAALRVDLDSDAGLREGTSTGKGASLYLPLGPLERRRREVVASLHQGRVVPQHGCASDFRVEEHVALLDHLQRAFRPSGEQRAARRHVAGTKIEVWVGLPEILSRGVGVGTDTGRFRALNIASASIDAQARARFLDATRRYLWLADASATGLGFQAMGADAEGLEIGDLLGWRTAAGGPLVLGTVMRLMPGADGAPLSIGVRVLTEAARTLPLSTARDYPATEESGTYLFVPGSDSSGSADTILVPENTFEARSTYRTRAGGNDYSLRFNRVRARGRGWVCAGFELLHANSAAAAPGAVQEDEEQPFPLLELDRLDGDEARS